MMPQVNGFCAALAAILFLVPRFSPAAEELPSAVKDLVRRTEAFLGPRTPAKLSYNNISSLADAELAGIRREFEASFPEAGDGTPAEIRLTLSENQSQYLLTEEIRKGEESRVWIAGWNRPAVSAASGFGLTLEKRLVWEQQEPILDLALSEDSMLVLSPSRLALYERHGEAWQQKGNLPFQPVNPWPRDLRGRLRVAGERVQVFLPGMECRGMATSNLSVECHASQDPWVLESGSRGILLANFAPERNYFDGHVVLQDGSRRTMPPFYAAAAGEDSGGTFWLLSPVEGQTGMFTAGFEQVGTVPSWGSDIVGISAPCAGGSQVLATRPGDGNEPDAIQAFSIVNRAANPVAAPLAFGGPITALWPATTSTALAVTRDPATGKYAAYLVTLACRH
jgi:hypothetical protein